MYLISGLSHGYIAIAKSTGLLPVPLDVAAYFTIGAIFLGLLYLWAVASTAKIARRRIWDTAIMCLSPLLIVHAFTNWDLLAIGLTAGAMLAWARKKPVLAGALFGLGAAAKLYPMLLLGPLLILCLRAGKMGAWTRAAIGCRGGLAGDQRPGHAGLARRLVRVHPAEFRASARVRLLVLHLRDARPLVDLGQRPRRRQPDAGQPAVAGAVRDRLRWPSAGSACRRNAGRGSPSWRSW